MACPVLPHVNCPNLQLTADELFGTCRVQPTTNLPIIRYLYSPQNRRGLMPAITGTGSRIRNVDMLVTPRRVESEVGDTIDYEVCDGGEDRGENIVSFPFDITKGVAADFLIKETELIGICKTNPEYYAEQFMKAIDVANRKMETILAQKIVSLLPTVGVKPGFADFDLGVFENDTYFAKVVKTTNCVDDPEQLAVNMLEEIQHSARQADYCSAPLIVGSGITSKYLQKFQSSCCNSGGLDLLDFLNRSQVTFLDSYRITQALGNDNYAISLENGAIQPVFFNLYRDLATSNDGNRRKFVFTDPNTGIPYDVLVDEKCNGVYTRVSVAFELYCQADSLYCTDDPLYGVKGIQLFKIDNCLEATPCP